MDRTHRLEMLVLAAQLGSFSAAAKSLDRSPSAVSKGIVELERSLQVTLFNRTTRQLQLTEDGKLICERAREILEKMSAIDDGVSRRRQQVSGVVRIGLSAALNRHVVMPRLAQFLDMHPDLTVELRSTQEPSAMQAENIDVLLHVGEPPPSRLVARHLVQGRPGVYGAPAYLRAHGTPSSPAELSQHRCLVFRPVWLPHAQDEWMFMQGANRVGVRIRPTVASSDREGLIVAAVAGAGLIYMACFDPALLHTGQLRPVLADWRCASSFNVYALQRRQVRPAPRIAAVLKFIEEAFAQFDPDEATILHAPTRGATGRDSVKGARA